MDSIIIILFSIFLVCCIIFFFYCVIEDLENPVFCNDADLYITPKTFSYFLDEKIIFFLSTYKYYGYYIKDNESNKFFKIGIKKRYKIKYLIESKKTKGKRKIKKTIRSGNNS